MNIDHIYADTIKNNIQCSNIIQPRRAPIYIGFKCSQKCSFCYYKNMQNVTYNYNNIIQQIDIKYDYGIRDFEITGGEPAEYEKLYDICKYIKNKNSSSKISIITNGTLWKIKNIWNIIDEVLLSYHIPKYKIPYPTIFFNTNIQYDIKKTIDKIKTYNLIFKTNTVIGDFNHIDLLDIVKDLLNINPIIINFLPLNLFESANINHFNLNYITIRNCIKRAIDYLNDNSYNGQINVRYFPFCDMISYEKYLVNQYQHIYDWFDWNRELDTINIITKQDIQKFGKYGSTSIDKVIQTRKFVYYKSTKCLKCKYNLICDGFQAKQYNIYAQPNIGSYIKNPLYFIQNKSYILYNQLYEF